MKIVKRISAFCMALCLFLTLMPMPVKAEENTNNLEVTINVSGQDTYEVLVEPDGSVTLEANVSADDMEGISFQWSRLKVDAEGYYYEEEIQGATSSQYTVESVTEKMVFLCTVRDKYFTFACDTINIGVENHLSVYIDDNTQLSVQVPLHGDITLTAYASADNLEGITYQWAKGGITIEGATSSTYVVQDATEPSTYTCRVSDIYGNSAGATTRVLIDNKLAVTINDSENNSDYYITVEPHTSLTLYAIVSATNTEEISYQWRMNGMDIEGATTSVYTIEDAAESAVYACTVTDKYGNSVDGIKRVSIANDLEAAINDADYNFSYQASVLAGESLTLEAKVSARDMEEISYQWEKDGMDIDGATSSSYTIEDVSYKSHYSCRVTDRYGNYVTTSATVSVENGFSAYINEDPFDLTVEPHGSLTLSTTVLATNTEGITYQWEKDGIAIEGASFSTYTIEDATTSALYSCAVTDRYGNTVNPSRRVVIDNKLTVTANDSENNSCTIYVKPGENAMLEAKVSADNMEGITYRWKSSKQNESFFTDIEGASSSILVVENVSQRMMFECTVNDTWGNVKRAYFYVYVDNELSACINEQDENDAFRVTVGVHESVTLSTTVSAINMEGISYQWSKDGVLIEGATASTYTIEDATETGYYSCIVTDKYDNDIRMDRQIKIDNKLTVTEKESGENFCKITVKPGEGATLEVKASAIDMEGMTYRWSCKPSNETDWISVEGADSSVYIVENVKENMDYHCTVSDAYGNWNLVAFIVSVDNELSVYINEKSENGIYSVTIPNHGSLTLSAYVSATNMNGISYLWKRNGKELEGGTTATYTIENISRNGDYYCIVTDAYGNSITAYAFVYVDNQLNVTINDSGKRECNVSVKPGGSVTLEAKVSAIDMDNISYGWSKDRKVVLEGETHSTCTISDIWENARYSCTVFDGYGAMWVDAYVRIDNELTVYINEKGEDNTYHIITAPHESVTLSAFASAVDMDGLCYQWQKYGTDLPGATSSTYIVPDVSESAVYSCVVTDKYGNTATSYAEIQVKKDIDNRLSATANDSDTNEFTTVLPKGNSMLLKAVVSAEDKAGITYQWFKYSDKNGYIEINGATVDQLEISDVSELSKYLCRIEDAYNNTVWTFYMISVDTGLQVADETVSVMGTKDEKSILVMNASANSDVEIQYQWYKWVYDDTSMGYTFDVISGEKGKELAIEKFEIGAKYRCDASTYGEVKSTVFELVEKTASDTDTPDDNGSDNNDSGNSGSDNSGSDNSGSDNSGSDNSGSDNSGSDNSGSDNSGSDNSGSDNSGSDNTDSDNSGSDNSGSDNSGSDNNNSDDNGSNNNGSDNGGSDDTNSDNNSDNNNSSGDSGNSGSNGSETQNPDSTSPEQTTPTDVTTITNEDGSTTAIKQEVVEDGSNVITAVTEKTDGTVETIIVLEKTDGSRESFSSVTWTDGRVVARKESTNADGTTTVITATANASGEVVSSSTTTIAADGSKHEVAEAKEKNKNGKTVDVTTTVDTDAAGQVVGSVEQSVIANAAKNTSVVVNVVADGSGTVQKATGEITRTVDAGTKKATIAGSVVNQIKEAAGTGVKTDVSMKVVDESGKTLYTVKGKTSSLKAGTKLYLYRLDVKTGKYIAVTDDTYKVSNVGSVSVSMDKKATYELVTAKEAKAIQNEIKKSIALKKTSATLQIGKTTTVAFKDTLDKRSVKSITYTSSDKKVATVDNNGKVTAKAAGTADIKAKVTLNDGTTKTVTMKITVK